MEEQTTSPSTSTNEYIDKITLELLINKTQYNKYIATTDLEKHKKITEFSAKMVKYSDQIMCLAEEYCSSSKTQKSRDMDETFLNYAKTCIRYFEMKELEGDPESAHGHTQEDVLFEPKPMHSFWGKGAVKRS